jgi:hypothetical protein
MSITLNKISHFQKQLFQKIQQLALISKYIDHHSSLELLSFSSYFNDLGYLVECFVDCIDCFPFLQMIPSTKIKIKYNDCIYIGENNEN